MPVSFKRLPIVLGLNPYTGKVHGDDAGYREIPVSPLDAANPDPLVAFRGYSYLVYAYGRHRALCPYYGKGLGGPNIALMRKPVLHGVEEVQRRLAPYGRTLLLLDAWRPGWLQAKLWAYIRAGLLRAEGLSDVELSLYNELRIGLAADEVGSYCAVLEDEGFQGRKHVLMTGRERDALRHAAERLSMEVNVAATLLLTFRANLGRGGHLDQGAVTAHGNGGTVDVWTVHTKTKRPCNLGVPFDYVARPGSTVSPAEMDYFDRPGVTPETYAKEVVRDPVLRQYLRELGCKRLTKDVFLEAQRERRILFHAMQKAGAEFYFRECWHFTFGNERGGKQAGIPDLRGSGCTCHAVLKGKKEGVWGNATAHRLAAQFLAR